MSLQTPTTPFRNIAFCDLKFLKNVKKKFTLACFQFILSIYNLLEEFLFNWTPSTPTKPLMTSNLQPNDMNEFSYFWFTVTKSPNQPITYLIKINTVGHDMNKLKFLNIVYSNIKYKFWNLSVFISEQLESLTPSCGHFIFLDIYMRKNLTTFDNLQEVKVKKYITPLYTCTYRLAYTQISNVPAPWSVFKGL